MKTIEDFKNYYNTNLRPALETLEGERKASLRKVAIAAAIIVAIALAGAGMVQVSGGSSTISLIVAAVGGVLIFGVWWLFTKDFKSNFKNTIIRQIIQYVDPSLSYAAEGMIARGAFEGSTLFKRRIDRYKGEDLVEGQIDKTRIRFSELHAEYKTTTTDSKGRRQTHWHTIFKGLFVIADFNKHFQGRTVVLPDSAEKLFGRLGQKLQSMIIKPLAVTMLLIIESSTVVSFRTFIYVRISSEITILALDKHHISKTLSRTKNAPSNKKNILATLAYIKPIIPKHPKIIITKARTPNIQPDTVKTNGRLREIFW